MLARGAPGRRYHRPGSRPSQRSPLAFVPGWLRAIIPAVTRLFVAIDVPEAQRRLLSLLCAGLPGARWVPGEQLHLTLRFIGEVDGGLFRDAHEALLSVRSPCFELRLEGLGHFPPRGAPRVVWAGLAASEHLRRLRAGVERALSQAGLPPEGRKFHAHVTLARLKNTPPRRVADYLGRHATFATEPFLVEDFVLYSSVLGAGGAVHRAEERYALGGAAEAPEREESGS